MLTLAETRAVLDRVSYKRGWVFAVREGRVEGNPDLTGGLHLVITACVPDAFGSGDVTLDVQVPLPPMVTPEDLVRFLQWRVLRCELHEAREFFRVDGRIYDSPHAIHADRDL